MLNKLNCLSIINFLRYVVLMCPSSPHIKLIWTYLIEQENERIKVHVKWKHFFQSFNHNVPFSKEAAMFCSIRAALCGPHHLGLGGADSMSFIQKKTCYSST